MFTLTCSFKRLHFYYCEYTVPVYNSDFFYCRKAKKGKDGKKDEKGKDKGKEPTDPPQEELPPPPKESDILLMQRYAHRIQ